MGKPTWVEGGGRRSSALLRMDSPEPAEPQFPRRLPRTGTAFQCKGIPEVLENYVSSRSTAPIRMSTQVPYRTVAEMEAFAASSGFLSDRAVSDASTTGDTALISAKGKRTELISDRSSGVWK